MTHLQVRQALAMALVAKKEVAKKKAAMKQVSKKKVARNKMSKKTMVGVSAVTLTTTVLCGPHGLIARSHHGS